MSKILITGGAGYIGSVLCEELLKNKHSVHVFDNFLYSNTSLAHLMNYKNLKITKGDIRDFKKLEVLLNKYEYVIPLAALVGAPICDREPFNADTVNYEANLKLFKKLKSSHKLIMPTTNSAYGSGNKNNYCDEKSKLKPLSKYAKDKVKIEKIIMKRKNSISLRLATVFGSSSRMRTDLLVNDFVRKAYFDKSLIIFEPHFKRNYIHVRDVANAVILMINNFEKLKGNIFNVGLSSANLSKLELAKKIKKYVKDLVIKIENFKKDKDQRNYIVSNLKIEKVGFIPEMTLNDGIQELIKYYSTQKNYDQGNV